MGILISALAALFVAVLAAVAGLLWAWPFLKILGLVVLVLIGLAVAAWWIIYAFQSPEARQWIRETSARQRAEMEAAQNHKRAAAQQAQREWAEHKARVKREARAGK